MDIELARTNMVTQQLHTWEVYDDGVLDLFSTAARENFVPKPYRKLAYADIMIPIGHEQVMFYPGVDARILQALAIQAHENVFEIGTGYGFLTALMAKQAKMVYSCDIYEDMTQAAEKNLHNAGIENVKLYTRDTAQGYPEQAPYDIIVLSGGVEILSDSIPQQLAVGGRLLAFIGKSPNMQATLVTRYSDSQWEVERLFEIDIPMLINAPQSSPFKF